LSAIEAPNDGLVEPVYVLLRESPETLAAAVTILAEAYFTGVDATGILADLGLSEPASRSPAEKAFVSLGEEEQHSLAQEYLKLCGQADIHWQNLDDKRATRTTSIPIRYEQARLAVMLRSQGHCENPRCTGDIQDLTDVGDPILEVDHVHDLAKGGQDLPAQMIALCPNCHAMKTASRPCGSATGLTSRSKTMCFAPRLRRSSATPTASRHLPACRRMAGGQEPARNTRSCNSPSRRPLGSDGKRHAPRTALARSMSCGHTSRRTHAGQSGNPA